MEKEILKSFQDYLDRVELNEILGFDVNLYRGQSDNSPLLPSIARLNPKVNTTQIEMKMLEDLKRRSQLLISKSFKNDWEWLVFAQHFGLKTRLLDWTSNPLIALWFACANEYKIKENSFVYVLSADNEILVDLNHNDSPFNNSNTKVLRPSLNNERIIAQSGWFTAHIYSVASNKFIDLDANINTKNKITELEIPANIKPELLRKLSIFGVNSRTIYPDIIGLCQHLNWKYQDEIFKSCR